MSRKHWFLSDPHFGHGNIMKYCFRTEFMTDEERDLLAAKQDFRVSKESVWRMNDAIIARTNELVQPDDVLWILGDWCFASGKFYYQDSRRCRDRLNVKTAHIVWGNHDSRKIADLFDSNHEQVMISINPHNGDYIVGEEEIGQQRKGRGWQKIVLNHYMMAIWNGSHKGNWHLYGHSHAGAEPWADSWMKGRRSLDVGVDNAKKLLGEYRPFSYDEISDHMAKQAGFSMDHHRERRR